MEWASWQLRTPKILIVLSGHFLIICLIRNMLEYILNKFECILNLIKALLKGVSIKYVCMHVNTCILGRTYFVERSIHLIEEH